MQKITKPTACAVAFRRAALAAFVAFALGGTCEAAAAGMLDHDALLALARSEHSAGHRVEALAHCEELLARWPDDRQAQWLSIQLLSELGASARANELASKLSPALNDAQRDRLKADYASHEVRWAKGMPADALHPYAEADKAIDDIRRLANDASAPTDVRRRAQLDLLVALDQADRADEVLSVYASLKGQGIALPPYAQWAVADALMQKHRPCEAIALYEDGIRRNPGPYDPSDTDPRIGLAYAYFDAGRTRDALSTIDKLAADEPRWRRTSGARGPAQNPRKVDADEASAQLHEDTGQLQETYAQLAAMSAEAPGNVDLRRQLAMAELARGWPRRAMETLKIAATLEDEHDAGADLDDADVRRAI
ncbi:MAG TPA: tetratricopeptide repeat protein, partial [Dyella sp.]|nr:tetratricopeptide repeat protein [Dyella sp.]